jgi:hypothetical protein
MFRFLFRFIGLWLLAGAIVALVIDGTRSSTEGRIVIMPLAEGWLAVHPASIDWIKLATECSLPAWVWDPVLVYVLYAPLWAALGVLGLILALLGRRRARPIGYSSRD